MLSRIALLIFVIIINIINLIGQELPYKTDIVNVMQLVNDYWIAEHSDPGNNLWARSAYFTGNMAMYEIYPKKKYLDYSLSWAEQNNWAPGSRPRHADDQCCGQTYIDLYKIEPDTSRISQIKQRIDDMVNSTKIDDWWWIDAYYMAMPVFTRLGDLFNDTSYFDKMYDLYNDTKTRRALYDVNDGLWFRDENFSAPEDTTPNGEKIFWSRGNGWVYGAHVRTLQLLPASDPHYAEYLETFKTMSEALRKAQHGDGFWGVSLADSNHYPGPETSGTGFFTYGLAWGINDGHLDSTDYYSTVAKAWHSIISTAVHPDGFLGYVQGVGSHPGSSQPVTYNSTADFGVGAFLLAGSEVFKLAEGDIPIPEPESENLAINTLIAFSSQQMDPYNPASNAVDGNEATRWSAETWPEWIEIDLGELKTINQTEIMPYQQRAYQYIIESKENVNDSYSTLVDKSSNMIGGQKLIDTLESVTTRYLKLTITGCHDYTGSWVSILEFKVFGEIDTNIEVHENLNNIKQFDLAYAFPNPFNSSATIRFELKRSTFVTLGIYNISGQKIETLMNAFINEGEHQITWHPRGLSSGIYFYRLQAGKFIQTKKLILQK